jgi:CRISPR-associated endonuclease/helicase Cas3
MLYAHTPPAGSDKWHELAEHLREVAELAAAQAARFGAEDVVRLAGLYHDLGKAHPEFQRYLANCHREPDKKHRSIEHKGAGIIALRDAAPNLLSLAYLIHGHHGGLPNADDLRTRIKGLTDDEDANTGYDVAKAAGLLVSEGSPPDRQMFPSFLFGENGRLIPEKFAFFLRMCFSTLVDADHLDAERHRAPEQAANRGGSPSIAECAARLESAQRRFVMPPDDAPERVRAVAHVRDDVYRACLARAEDTPGFFRLTVPTGGGKTRSSLAFALNHVLHYIANDERPFGLERVIVAVPYLTITEQTADDYRKAFGDDARAILEHHSGVAGRNRRDVEAKRDDEEGSESADELWRQLATQDWDAPIIVTTTVQLFESLFGRKTSSCRKLHRIARSVVILDEAQTLPATLLQPILDALRHLVADYGTSVVLCTATQPALDEAAGFRGLPDVREIAPNPPRLFEVLKRVRYTWPEPGETWTWEETAQAMRAEERILTIVNTKGDALALLATLGDDFDTFHLSTLLCGAHRRDVLAIVRRRLKELGSCRLVSTQVVEAGVDLDFPIVLRAMGPLDGIVQAAGRCNREGTLGSSGRVIVFDPAEARPLPKGVYQTGAALTRVRLARGELDLDHPETFVEYFRHLYRQVRNLDRPDIGRLQNELQFEDVAREFNMIEEDTASVVVPYKGIRPELRSELPDEQKLDHKTLSREVMDELRKQTSGKLRGDARGLFARAQPYLVTRRKSELEKDRGTGYVSGPFGGLWVWERGYDCVSGLTTERPPEDFFA